MHGNLKEILSYIVIFPHGNMTTMTERLLNTTKYLST